LAAASFFGAAFFAVAITVNLRVKQKSLFHNQQCLGVSPALLLNFSYCTPQLTTP
jgi:hypothetical protein